MLNEYLGLSENTEKNSVAVFSRNDAGSEMCWARYKGSAVLEENHKLDPILSVCNLS